MKFCALSQVEQCGSYQVDLSATADSSKIALACLLRYRVSSCLRLELRFFNSNQVAQCGKLSK